MEQKELTNIYNTLSRLSPEELEQVRLRCTFLLSSKPKLDGASRPEIALYEIIRKKLYIHGCTEKYPPFETFKKRNRNVYPKFLDLYQWLNEWFRSTAKDSYLSRSDRLLFYSLFCYVVISHILQTKVAPLCLKSVIEVGRKSFDTLVDRSFPGYFPSGLWKVVVEKANDKVYGK